MRHGSDSRLILSKSGNLVAIATGSDACAEHECGARPLLNSLANYSDDDDKLIAALRQGNPVQYPSIFEKARITKQPSALQFLERKDKAGNPEAMMGLAKYALNWDNNELAYPWRQRDENQAVTGAWDSDSFAVRVRGAKYVKALKAFYEDLLAGHCYFGGRFYEAPNRESLGGILLVNGKFMDDESKQRTVKAQALYESNLRLKAKDDVRELHQAMRAAGGPGYTDPGYIWVVWANGPDSEIRYALNPGYRVKAQYLGPYTRQQLLDWAKANCSYELKPLKD